MTNSKILICAEQDSIRESLKITIGDLYNLIMVDSGESALEVLSHSKDIKVIILDSQAVMTDGKPAAAAIAKKYPGIKTIAFSKPFKIQEIADQVAGVQED